MQPWLFPSAKALALVSSLSIYTHTQATLPEVPHLARYIFLDVTTINFPSFPFLPVLKREARVRRGS